MKTPLCDFVKAYSQTNPVRLHMPGHKGNGPLGIEGLDITEIEGADSLYEADGILAESERNASALFGADTFYSTEGSSLAIRAMLYLARLHAQKTGARPLVAAGRNAHKVFLYGVALLDWEILWLTPDEKASYLSCTITAQSLERQLAVAGQKPAAVYLTSPDYLGNVVALSEIAAFCHREGILLLVDNAHGAYLKFLPDSRHPIDLGADLVCDSAHKTLPTLTGGAYLHLSKKAPAFMRKEAKNALALFGSTSPSYLILQSLDATNAYLAGDYRARLQAFLGQIEALKCRLAACGFGLCGNEPLKLTLATKPYGYTGHEVAAYLRQNGVVCEFADPDFVVMMATPENGSEALSYVEHLLTSLEKKAPLTSAPPAFHLPKRVLSPKEALFSDSETVPADKACGYVLAVATVGCPPAVPIVTSGEEIDRESVAAFAYYGLSSCRVVKGKQR